MMLIYANRTHRTVMFSDLHDLKDRYPERFHLVHVLSREQRDVELFSDDSTATDTRILKSLMPVEEVDSWFLCGPQRVVLDLRELSRPRR